MAYDIFNDDDEEHLFWPSDLNGEAGKLIQKLVSEECEKCVGEIEKEMGFAVFISDEGFIEDSQVVLTTKRQWFKEGEFVKGIDFQEIANLIEKGIPRGGKAADTYRRGAIAFAEAFAKDVRERMER